MPLSGCDKEGKLLTVDEAVFIPVKITIARHQRIEGPHAS